MTTERAPATPARAVEAPRGKTNPPWERGEFKFWVVALSVLALLAAVLGAAAIAVAASKADRTVVRSGATRAGQAIDFTAEPDAAFEARDPAAPATPAGTVHQIRLEATEEPLEIAPGVTQTMWTFGGQVPGPVLRGKVGDTFEVTLVNSGQNSHSIDFHASKVAWNDEMRSIAPGESLIYRFTAKHSGVFMYHCGTPPVIHHIGNGMYGAIVIDPPELAPVDHEYVMVQSELYRAPVGETGDLNRMLDEQWDGVVFNGYVNQYQHRPIRVEPNERVRIWVLDAGPSENSSFHVIGTIFDTVYKEGSYVLRPGDTRGGSQALDLQPAQGGFVEFTFDVPGLYPFVTHKFASASKGSVGLFQAGEVATPEGGAAH
jgi:nitrite reductase (NO-forming)